MYKYKCLQKCLWSAGEYSLVPIRMVDRYAIMKMRNEQLFHLRQTELLTPEKQEYYFAKVIANLFEVEKPDQLLFSLLYSGEFIGYGGLVHINWDHRHAEISFIMKTELQEDHFDEYWNIFLYQLETIAFEELNFHKIFTYAYDLRPMLYKSLEKASFREEARLREHCYFNDKFIDVVIHSKFNNSALS